MREIRLTSVICPEYRRLANGMVALVDDEDYERLSAFRWRAQKMRDDFYAVRYIPFLKPDGRHSHRARQMQQDILYSDQQPPKRMKADHENRNTLDNQRCNLSLKTDSASNINRGLFRTNKTGFRGVSWCSSKRRFMAHLRHKGRRFVGGGHSTAEDAARAYNSLARIHHGEHAHLNVIPGGGPQFFDEAISRSPGQPVMRHTTRGSDGQYTKRG